MICDCGRNFKDSRAWAVHLYRGCDAAIADCFKDGESFEELARRFRKPLAKIENSVRLEILRRREAG
jgi:hypothetical protein